MNDDASKRSNELPQRFVDAFRTRFGSRLDAVLLYGSWLRGKRDTVLDFYVLLNDTDALPNRLHALGNRLLAPNVYHISLDGDDGGASAKYATLTLTQFERAIARDFHSYFWARFSQPVELPYVRSDATAARIGAACDEATRRMIIETAPLLPLQFTTAALWQRALTLTYGCELRSENPSRALTVADGYAGHFAARTAAVADRAGLLPRTPETWQLAGGARSEHRVQWRWRRRRLLGKLLSVLRLLKAAFTFNDPLDYVLWKVERHSGVREDATERQRRHPLIFAWPVLWRLYRRGGFR